MDKFPSQQPDSAEPDPEPSPTDVGGGPSTSRLRAAFLKWFQSLKFRIVQALRSMRRKSKPSMIDVIDTASVEATPLNGGTQQELLFQIIALLSNLRRFDISVLTILLPQYFPSDFESEKLNSYMILLEDLLRADLVGWSHEYQGYAVSSPVQTKIIDLQSRISKIDKASLHSRMVDLYQMLMSTNPEYQSLYIGEILYHSLQVRILMENNKDNIISQFKGDIVNNVFSLRESSKFLIAYQMELLARIENDQFFIHFMETDLLKNFIAELRKQVNANVAESDLGLDILNGVKRKHRYL